MSELKSYANLISHIKIELSLIYFEADIFSAIHFVLYLFFNSKS